jgi:hypothetical protein
LSAASAEPAVATSATLATAGVGSSTSTVVVPELTAAVVEGVMLDASSSLVSSDERPDAVRAARRSSLARLSLTGTEAAKASSPTMASTKPGLMLPMALSSAGAITAVPLTFSAAGAASTGTAVGATVTASFTAGAAVK